MNFYSKVICVAVISMTLQFIFTFCQSSKFSHPNILRKNQNLMHKRRRGLDFE